MNKILKLLEVTDPPIKQKYVVEKLNEVIDRLNEVCSRLFPSISEKKENKGYENEEFDNKIGDPNDK